MSMRQLFLQEVVHNSAYGNGASNGFPAASMQHQLSLGLSGFFNTHFFYKDCTFRLQGDTPAISLPH
jgi:hypothetical protein